MPAPDPPLEEYISMAKDKPEIYALNMQWDVVISMIDKTLKTVKNLVEDLSKIKDQFVFEDTYRYILYSLEQRRFILNNLRAVAAPHAEDELDALEKAAKNYRALMKHMEKLSDELASHVKRS